MKIGYIICLTDGSVIPAQSVDILDEVLRFTSSKGVGFSLNPSQITKVWEVAPEHPLPLGALDSYTHLVAALYDCEQAYLRYQSETGLAPSSLPFCAASLTLSVLPLRTSEDVDIVLPQAFIDWADQHWKDHGHLQFDLAHRQVLRLCGSWEDRISKLQGHQLTFALLHPYDTLMQKLLRRDQVRFFERDCPDIEAILAALPPEPGTLEFLLTGNYLRYLSDPRDPVIPNQADAVKHNTTWFLNRFLPHLSFEEIATRATLRNNAELSRLSLAPRPDRSLADFVTLSRLPLPQSDGHPR